MTAVTEAVAEFDAPPAEPISLLRRWLAGAVERNVAEPSLLALATSDAAGRVSNRIVRILDVTATGLVFTSHAGSRKGRDLSHTPWASGVLYWRETKQQIIVAGPAEPLPAEVSDALWTLRSPGIQAMSAASQQSAPLADEKILRQAAKRLAAFGTPLPRPETWLAYQLVPSAVEFWQGAADGLHRRLSYERTGAVWTTRRLQP